MSEPMEFPSGDTIPGSSGSEESHVEESPASSSTDSQEAAGFNEAWKPLLDQIPTEFHKLIQPELSKWDKNYQSLQEKYNPYKDFEGVAPQDLASAHTLLQQINDPEGARRIYEGLGEVLGISAKEAEQVAKAVEAAPKEPEVDPEDLTPEQREIRELRQSLSEIKDAQNAQQTIAQQQAQVALQKTYEDNYTKSFEDIFTKDPSLKTDEIRRTDLHNRAMAYIQNPDFHGDEVQQAWIDQRKYNDYLAGVLSSRQDPNSHAPLHIAPSGGNPGSGVDPSKRTEQERSDAFKQMLAAAQNQ